MTLALEGAGGVMIADEDSHCLKERRIPSMWKELGRIILLRNGTTEVDEAIVLNAMTHWDGSIPWRVILIPPTWKKRARKRNL